jgi:hypothetical protein
MLYKYYELRKKRKNRQTPTVHRQEIIKAWPGTNTILIQEPGIVDNGKPIRGNKDFSGQSLPARIH